MSVKDLVLALCLIIVIGCNSNKSNQDNESVIENTSLSTSAEKKSNYWQSLKKELSLTKDELKRTKAIVSKYNKRKKDLKKKSIWDGDANKHQRKRWTANRKSDLVKVLGKKRYQAKVRFDKNNKS